MDWEFFEQWAEISTEDRRRIIIETGNNTTGDFIGLIMSIPARSKLDDLKQGLTRHLQSNDK